jgi:cytochrome c oxidase assembly factor CtaG
VHVDPFVILGLALAAVLYWRGARAVRLAPSRVATFYAGLLTIALALLSPLATLSEQLFLAHMIQHLLLIMVAVPLVLLGAPAVPLARGLPREVRAVYLVPLARSRAWHTLARVATNPLVAFGAYIGLLTVWHLPALYDAAVQDAVIHALEHFTFLAIALLFWSQVIDPSPFRAPLRHPLRIVYLFVATAHNTALGGILAFADPSLYPYYAGLATRPFGISAAFDQQAGGAIMWVPGGMVHLIAISFVFAAWLSAEDRADVSSRALPDHV